MLKIKSVMVTSAMVSSAGRSAKPQKEGYHGQADRRLPVGGTAWKSAADIADSAATKPRWRGATR